MGTNTTAASWLPAFSNQNRSIRVMTRLTATCETVVNNTLLPERMDSRVST